MKAKQLPWRDILWSLVFLGVFVAGLLWTYNEFFFHKKERLLSKTLVGKPISEVTKHLGAPRRIHQARDFNGKLREDILKSYSPKSMPMAKEKVWEYDYFPWLTLIFVEREVVVDVYNGGT